MLTRIITSIIMSLTLIAGSMSAGNISDTVVNTAKDSLHTVSSVNTDYPKPKGKIRNPWLSDVHEHHWTETTVKATCEKSGKHIYECTECGYWKTTPIAATGHSLATREATRTKYREEKVWHSQWECGCGYKTENKSAWYSHQNACDGYNSRVNEWCTIEEVPYEVKVTEYYCTVCGAVMPEETAFDPNTHTHTKATRTRTETETKYRDEEVWHSASVCGCGYRTSDKAAWTAHVNEHPKYRTWVDEWCEVVKKPYTVTHTITEVYCTECGKILSTSRS